MKKTLLLFFMAGALLASCKKQETLPEQQTATSSTKKPLSAGDDLWDVLGYGYNVLGIYANSSAATFPVLNIEQFKADYPDRVNLDRSKTQYPQLFIGTDAEDYLKKISTSVGGGFSVGADEKAPGFFKATIKAAFSDSSAFSSQYLYSSYALIIKQKRLNINSPVDLLKNYLNATFASDVQTQSPAYIVSHYGTHVLIDITLGAKLELVYRSATLTTNRQDASSGGLDVSVLGLFNLNTNIHSTTIQSSTNYNATLHYVTYGGDPSKSLIGDIPLNGTFPATINSANWQSSSTEANAELIDIGPSGLIEISQLIADPAKASALHNYIVQYLNDNQAQLLPAPVYEFFASNINKFAYNLNPNLNVLYPNYAAYGETFKAYTFQYAATVPVYQFYNNNIQDHLLTTDPSAAGSWIQKGYYNNGILFYAYTTQVPGTVPVYAFYDYNGIDHLYSTNINATSGYPTWAYQGVCFYAYPKTIN